MILINIIMDEGNQLVVMQGTMDSTLKALIWIAVAHPGGDVSMEPTNIAFYMSESYTENIDFRDASWA